MQQNFRVGMALEHKAARLEIAPQRLIIVYLAVEGDRKLAVGARHGLSSGRRKVYDRQTPMAKAYASFRRDPFAKVVGTPLRHVIARARKLAAINRIGAR